MFVFRIYYRHILFVIYVYTITISKAEKISIHNINIVYCVTC